MTLNNLFKKYNKTPIIYMIKINFLIFFIPIIIFFILINKPFYMLFFLTFFTYEYFFIINFLITIYKNKNIYYSIEIKKIDPNYLSTIDIWIECCKINAFKKIYYILSKKKKINIKNFLSIAIIFFFSIPIKILNTIYKILSQKNKKKLRNKIISYYYSECFYKIKEKKIEILDKEIFLNMKKSGTNKLYNFMKELRFEINSVKNKKDICNFLMDLKEVNYKILKFKQDNQMVEKFRKMNLYDHKDQLIQSKHFTIQFKNTYMHHTSNLNFKKLENQKTDKNITSLTKPGSKLPGTVLTPEVKKAEYDDKDIEVPRNEFEYILWNKIKDFPDLNIKDENKIFYDEIKVKTVNLMKKHEISTNTSTLNQIMSGEYSETLSEISENEIGVLVNDWFSETI